MSVSVLVDALSSCEVLLRRVGESSWSKKVGAMIAQNHDVSAQDARAILGWYGGMGSFNDLVISRFNNHQVLEAQEDALNEELDRLRARIFEEATNLVRAARL